MRHGGYFGVSERKVNPSGGQGILAPSSHAHSPLSSPPPVCPSQVPAVHCPRPVPRASPPRPKSLGREPRGPHPVRPPGRKFPLGIWGSCVVVALTFTFLPPQHGRYSQTCQLSPADTSRLPPSWPWLTPPPTPHPRLLGGSLASLIIPSPPHLSGPRANAGSLSSEDKLTQVPAPWHLHWVGHLTPPSSAWDSARASPTWGPLPSSLRHHAPSLGSPGVRASAQLPSPHPTNQTLVHLLHQPHAFHTHPQATPRQRSPPGTPRLHGWGSQGPLTSVLLFLHPAFPR